MRKFTQAIHGGAVQARSVAGVVSATLVLLKQQHRFPSEHSRFGRRRPELSAYVVRASVASRVYRAVPVPRCHEFVSSNVGASLLCGVERGAEVAVPLRQQHNAPVSLSESIACQRTVVVNRPENHPAPVARNHAPNRPVQVAPCIRGFVVCVDADRKAVVLSFLHQRSNPSVEGTRSGLRPPRAPHLKR